MRKRAWALESVEMRSPNKRGRDEFVRTHEERDRRKRVSAPNRRQNNKGDMDDGGEDRQLHAKHATSGRRKGGGGGEKWNCQMGEESWIQITPHDWKSHPFVPTNPVKLVTCSIYYIIQYESETMQNLLNIDSFEYWLGIWLDCSSFQSSCVLRHSTEIYCQANADGFVVGRKSKEPLSISLSATPTPAASAPLQHPYWLRKEGGEREREKGNKEKERGDGGEKKWGKERNDEINKREREPANGFDSPGSSIIQKQKEERDRGKKTWWI